MDDQALENEKRENEKRENEQYYVPSRSVVEYMPSHKDAAFEKPAILLPVRCPSWHLGRRCVPFRNMELDASKRCVPPRQ